MPPRRRFGIATASSLGFHVALFAIIGISGSRPRIAAEQLIPIEIATAPAPVKAEPPVEEVKTTVPVNEGSQPKLTLGGGNPKGTRSRRSTPAFRSLGTKRVASSGSGKLPAAPAPPKIITSKGGKEPSGPVGEGRDPGGPGGKADAIGGPSYGAGIAGAGGPLATYPKNALDQNLEGSVTLTIAVGADGSMKSASVTNSSGQKLLDAAALRAVKSGWSFTSGMKNGKPAAGTVTVTFVFSGGAVKRG
ncbi:MAG: TonB family protein [Armatimonadota bacterium]|jgi:TonB family protein